MPNWAEGTLKLRGRRENVASALKEMLLGNKGATLEEEYDGTLLRFKNEYDYFYINGTRLTIHGICLLVDLEDR